MNLTEPHAGSDLGALTTRAEKQADGTYRIFGTKIFITYGDHEMTDNIIHLVLARLPDAPPGTRGISLFLVPKYLVNKDGTLGARNDVAVRRRRAQARHPCQPHLRDEVRREGRRRRLSGRRGEPRPQRHVHHDERGPAGGRHAGRGGGRAGDAARARLRQGAPPGPQRLGQGRRHEPDHRARRHPPQPDDHEGADPGRPRHLPGDGQGDRRVAPRQGCGRARRRGQPRRAAHARSPRPSPPTSAARWPRSACRSTAAWASSRRPAPPSTIATRASCRSTRAPTASRPSTSSRASCRWKAARWSRPTSAS